MTCALMSSIISDQLDQDSAGSKSIRVCVCVILLHTVQYFIQKYSYAILRLYVSHACLVNHIILNQHDDKRVWPKGILAFAKTAYSVCTTLL